MSKSIAQIRLFVIKEDNEYEVLKHEIFTHRLISGPTKEELEKFNKDLPLNSFSLDKMDLNYDNGTLTDEEWTAENISQIGFDGIDEDIKEVLAEYNDDSIIEILGDYVIDSYYHSSWYGGEEWEQEDALINIQHRQLSDSQIRKFIGPFKKDENNFIKFENENCSLNHGSLNVN